MSKANFLTADVSALKAIFSSESASYSDAEYEDWNVTSQSDPHLRVFDITTEQSTSTDSPYILRYKGKHSDVRLSPEHYFHKTDLEQGSHGISHQIRLRCSHILVKHVDSDRPSSLRAQEIYITKEAALRKIVRTRRVIRTGKLSFGTMARVLSDCCSSKHKGDLGVIHLGQTWPEFEKVLRRLEIGEMSQVFETIAGFHLILRTNLEPDKNVGWLPKARSSKIVLVNDKIKTRKHIRRDQNRFSSEFILNRLRRCQNFENLHEPQKSSHKDRPTKEEQNDLSIKLYEEQQRRIKENIQDNDLTGRISELIFKDVIPDNKDTKNILQYESSEISDDEERDLQKSEDLFVVRNTKNATDLIHSDSSTYEKTKIYIPRNFLVSNQSSLAHNCITISSSKSPSDFDLDEYQFEMWKQPNYDKEVDFLWERKTPLKLTSTTSDD